MAESAWELFRQDALRWVDRRQAASPESLTFRKLVRLLYENMPLRAIAWFRFGSWLQTRRVRGLPFLIQQHIYFRYGLELSVGAEIGGGLYVPHTFGTVMYPARMGKNCSVIASVTIGMRNEWDFPVIGDDVFIGAGARVLGGITLGDGAQVGANAVVIHDVPAHTTVVGIPARPIGGARQPVPLAQTASREAGA